MSLFPIFVKLRGRLVVVVGGGEIAAGKIEGLLRAGARVRVIAPEVYMIIACQRFSGTCSFWRAHSSWIMLWM